MNQTNTNPLFYFSGTGGCLATARSISKELPEYTPVPIASLSDGYTVAADAIGMVFPLYTSGLPRIAAEFLNNLTFSKPCYIFAVIPCGHPVSGYALKQIDRILKNKGQRLCTGFYLKMTDNYLPMFDMPTGVKLEKIYRKYDLKLEKIIADIHARKNVIAPSTGWAMYQRNRKFINTVSNMDSYFIADEKCTGCGQCERVCPMNSIVITDSKPVWQHKCEFCHACIHLCPQHAIQWKTITQKKGRYHFKGVTASDIAKQKQLPK